MLTIDPCKPSATMAVPNTLVHKKEPQSPTSNSSSQDSFVISSILLNLFVFFSTLGFMAALFTKPFGAPNICFTELNTFKSAFSSVMSHLKVRNFESKSLAKLFESLASLSSSISRSTAFPPSFKTAFACCSPSNPVAPVITTVFPLNLISFPQTFLLNF